MAAILVGEDGPSKTYVNAKVKACERVGFKSTLIQLNSNVSEKELLNQVDLLNKNKDIDGFIVQLPLPKHIDENKIILAVNPEKDVDGFHPENVGKMTLGLPTFLPATPNGIIELLKSIIFQLLGKIPLLLEEVILLGLQLVF